MDNVIIEVNLILNRSININSILDSMNSATLVSTEDVNKYSFDRAKRLEKKWIQHLGEFDKHDKLIRHTIFCDVFEVPKIFKGLVNTEDLEFLLEAKALYKEVLTKNSEISNYNIAKIKLPNHTNLNIEIFGDRKDYKKKLNHILREYCKVDYNLTRHHYDTITQEFLEHSKCELELCLN